MPSNCGISWVYLLMLFLFILLHNKHLLKSGLFYQERICSLWTELPSKSALIPIKRIYYVGKVVQSIVSLTSLLVVKMLTVLVSTIFNSPVFLLKNVISFCKCKSYPHFIQQKY